MIVYASVLVVPAYEELYKNVLVVWYVSPELRGILELLRLTLNIPDSRSRTSAEIVTVA
jgi:hypothetical protein